MSVGSLASAHAPRDDVIVHGIVGINQPVSGCCHALILVKRRSRLGQSSANVAEEFTFSSGRRLR